MYSPTFFLYFIGRSEKNSFLVREGQGARRQSKIRSYSRSYQSAFPSTKSNASCSAIDTYF